MGRGRGSGGRGCWRVGEKDCGLGVMGDLREMRETSTGGGGGGGAITSQGKMEGIEENGDGDGGNGGRPGGRGREAR